MKSLFYSACSYGMPHMGVLLDKMLEERHNGTEVVFSYCKKALSSCDFNIHGNTAMCSFCQLAYKDLLDRYCKDICVYPIAKKHSNKDLIFEFNTIEELRQITYRNIPIGLSLVSFYVSWTRDKETPFTEKHLTYFNTLLKELCEFVDNAYTLIEEVKPDTILIYNGRLYESRVFYDIAKLKGINFVALEIVGGKLWSEDKYLRTQYNNGLPQDITEWTNQVLNIWNKAKESEDYKIEMGASFFEKRRAGKPAADKVYVKNQVADLLPEGFDKTKTNIVIFNSSDDERYAIGGEWDDAKLFKTQYEAAEYICQNVSGNTHVYLRIHPNLAGLPYKYHTELYDLKKYPNITIIEPTNPISSYALLDVCDTVVVFGSTMGVEGCYWGKPVILLEKAMYYNLGICYIPKNKEEFRSMLSRKLEPLERLNAIKYGYMCLDRKYRVAEHNYIDINYQHSYKYYKRLEYMTILRSHALYYYLYRLYYFVFKKISKNKTELPVKLHI